MIDWLKEQGNFIKDSYQGSAGASTYGARLARQEAIGDAAMDTVIEPLLKFGAGAAIIGGGLYGGYQLTQHGGNHAGPVAGGVILGGLAGGVGMGLLGRADSNNGWTKARWIKNLRTPEPTEFGPSVRMMGNPSKLAMADALGAEEGILGKGLGMGLKYGGPVAGAVAGIAIGGAIGAAHSAGLGVLPTIGIGLGAVAALHGASYVAGGAFKAMGGLGAAGLGAAVGRTGMAVAQGAMGAFSGIEHLARIALTGNINPIHLGGLGKGNNPFSRRNPFTVGGGSKSALDSWFPFFRNTEMNQVVEKSYTRMHGPHAGMKGELDHVLHSNLLAKGKSAAAAEEEAFVKAGTKIFDPRKFAPNPKIIRRLVGWSALFAIGSGIKEALNPMIAPPTAHFDGRYMHHINDMGTGGGYGMGVMGQNSALNFNAQDATRMIGHMF